MMAERIEREMMMLHGMLRGPSRRMLAGFLPRAWYFLGVVSSFLIPGGVCDAVATCSELELTFRKNIWLKRLEVEGICCEWKSRMAAVALVCRDSMSFFWACLCWH